MSEIIFDVTPAGFDIESSDRFLDIKNPNQTINNPSDNYVISAANKYGFNWPAIWCLFYLEAGQFKDTDAYDRNYLQLKNADGTSQRFRSFAEGVEASMQHLAVLYGKPLQDAVIWPGTQLLIDKNQPAFTTTAELDKAFGANMAASVEALYKEFCDFVAGVVKNPDELHTPIIIAPQPVDSLPVTPSVPAPVAKPATPATATTSSSMPKWLLWVGGIIAVLGGSVWVISTFTSYGPVLVGVLAFLKPAWAFIQSLFVK